MTNPTVPESFHWTDEAWGPGLRCRALSRLAPHVFTTRQLELLSASDRQPLAGALGVTAVASVTQVHGRAVVVVRRGQPPQQPCEADALVSDSPEVAIAVRAADCVPLLMCDGRSGAVAAVHAGWRGTAARAAVAALDALTHEFGTRPGDVVAAIGPAIGPCCYEVGSELVDAFAAARHERRLIDRWFLATPPRRGSSERPKLRLDVPGANRDQLVLAGVPEDQIYTAGLCTAMHLDLLTSFRAEKDKAGRIAGAIRAQG